MRATFLILILLMLSGCMGTKQVAEKTTEKTTTESTEVNKDSLVTTEVNRPIFDKVKTQVPETGDAELDKKIVELLEKLSTQKSSGSNSYNFYYDKLKREIIAEFEIGQTEDKETITDTESTTEVTTTEVIDEYVKKKITAMPWWVWAALVFLLRYQIFGIVGFFFPQIRAIKTISDLKFKKHGS